MPSAFSNIFTEAETILDLGRSSVYSLAAQAFHIWWYPRISQGPQAIRGNLLETVTVYYWAHVKSFSLPRWSTVWLHLELLDDVRPEYSNNKPMIICKGLCAPENLAEQFWRILQRVLIRMLSVSGVGIRIPAVQLCWSLILITYSSQSSSCEILKQSHLYSWCQSHGHQHSSQPALSAPVTELK